MFFNPRIRAHSDRSDYGMCLPCLCLLPDFNSFEQQRDTPVIDLDTGFYRTDYLPPNLKVRYLGMLRPCIRTHFIHNGVMNRLPITAT